MHNLAAIIASQTPEQQKESFKLMRINSKSTTYKNIKKVLEEKLTEAETETYIALLY